jgi:transposase-like protein
VAVRWYLRYSLSLRDVEELLEERGLNVDHTHNGLGLVAVLQS